MYLDEMDNEQLRRHMRTSPWDDFAQELRRVSAVILDHALTGADTSYFQERELLLKKHLGHAKGECQDA